MSCESSDDGHDLMTQDSEMPLDRRRSSAVLDTSDVQIDIEMEEDETGTGKPTKSKGFMTNSYSNGECSLSAEEDIERKPSFDDKKPESASRTSGSKKIRENHHPTGIDPFAYDHCENWLHLRIIFIL
jgi:hypothetical protein